MSLQTTVTDAIAKNIADAIDDPRIQKLLQGKMLKRQIRDFFRHFIVTHLNSIQVLSFLNTVVPDESSALVRENLLEEMGLEEAERSHPELLLDLARGFGAGEGEIRKLEAEAREARRRFAAAPLAYPSLRDLGMAILLETLTFETFLSRISDQVADALTDHYGLSTEAVRWFTLHGEVDVRHAEEGKRVVEDYIAYHRFGEAEVEEIVHRTLAGNVVLARYFPTKLQPARRSSIAAVDIYLLRIPFHQAFAHARMDRDASDAVVVRVSGVDGRYGYGEGLPRPYVTGEDVEGVVQALRKDLAPLVMGRSFASGRNILRELEHLSQVWNATQHAENVTAWNATFSAMELALLDWSFGRSGNSVTEWLLPARQEVVYTGVIEATDPDAAAALASRYVAANFGLLKVKVGVGDDERRLAAVRKAAGNVGLRVDANGAWTADDAVSMLRRFEEFSIDAVEQPVAASDIDGMRFVREETGLRVVADESLVTLEDAKRLIDATACDIFNVRVSKCGGLLNSLAVADLALAAGLEVQIGAQVGETSLLSAAGRHLAAHLPTVSYVEGSFGTHLLTEDITTEPVMFGPGGRAYGIVGDGLGVTVDLPTLERLAIEHVRVEA